MTTRDRYLIALATCLKAGIPEAEAKKLAHQIANAKLPKAIHYTV